VIGGADRAVRRWDPQSAKPLGNDIAPADKAPDVAPTHVNLVDLRDMVLAFDGFDDDPKRSGEKILEAIQATWIEEAG